MEKFINNNKSAADWNRKNIMSSADSNFLCSINTQQCRYPADKINAKTLIFPTTASRNAFSYTESAIRQIEIDIAHILFASIL